MIREATIEDIQAIANIHVAALPNDLLSTLGINFLRKYFYPTVIESKHAVTIVNDENNEIRSFIIFAYDSKALTMQVMGKKIILAWYSFLGILKKLSFGGEIIGCLRGFETELYLQLDDTIEEIPELYLMATAPKHHSKGIGSILIKRGLEILFEQGHYRCIVKTSSDRAKQFYLKHNFEEIGLERRQRRKLTVLLFTCNSSEQI